MIDQLKHPTEFLFAHWAVASTKDARGTRWQELVNRVAKLPSTHPDALAFALMMVRINSCLACDATRYRDKGGCATCSRFSLSTLNKENEASLLTRYHAAQKEIVQMLAEHSPREKAA